MITEMLKGVEALQSAKGHSPHTLAIMEGPTNCNRTCSYCTVPKRWNREEASTADQSFKQIDWLYEQGFRVLNYVGGEPLAGCQFEGGMVTGRYRMCEYGQLVWDAEYEDRLKDKLAPYTTKEGFTFMEHTLKVVEYASTKGMFTNVTTNSDFLDNTYHLGKLKKAGLDFLTFSLHSYNRAGLSDVVSKARATAQEGIIPIVSVVFTADRAETIPQYARICAANGLLFSTSVVQEIGGGFSALPSSSQIPSIDQQRYVFGNLLPLKRAGFILNNQRYLTEAVNFPGNSWRCDPETNSFIHIRAKGEKGELGVCPEVRTAFDSEVDLDSREWREKKRNLVDNCSGCLYSCFFQSENTDFKGDLRTAVNMILIKSGHWGVVRRLGRYAVGKDSKIISVPQS